MGFSMVYGALLTKTNRISRIFHSAAQSARRLIALAPALKFKYHLILSLRPSYISPRSQLIITGILVSVQFAGALLWVLLAFPGAHKVYPERDEVSRWHYVRGIFGEMNPTPPVSNGVVSQVILKCNVKDSSFLISQLYNMILITVCTFYAIRTRKVPENFNEAKFIGFTMYTTCVIWAAFVPIYFGTGNSFEVDHL